jgi:hypothetical protein
MIKTETMPGARKAAIHQACRLSAWLSPCFQIEESEESLVGRIGRSAAVQRFSVQLSQKASAEVLNSRPSRSRGHGMPPAWAPFSVNRVPAAGIRTVLTP